MDKIIRGGITISPHRFKNVYKYQRARDKSLITLSITEESRHAESGTRPNLVSFSCQHSHTELKEFDPHKCILAAGIYNGLLHFPFRPGYRIYAVDTPLETLENIARIVGDEGWVLGVFQESDPFKPSEKDMVELTNKYQHITLMTHSFQYPTLENYKRLLSLSTSSKFAFLMGVHPRLGAGSSMQKLIGAPVKIAKHIFAFVECNDVAEVNCLFIHSAHTKHVDFLRAIAVSHLNIIKNWKRPFGYSSHANCEHMECSTRVKPEWVVLDVPTDDIIVNDPSPSVGIKMQAVIHSMQYPNIGLEPKEQLLLGPYFARRAFFLFEATEHADQRKPKHVEDEQPTHSKTMSTFRIRTNSTWPAYHGNLFEQRPRSTPGVTMGSVNLQHVHCSEETNWVHKVAYGVASDIRETPQGPHFQNDINIHRNTARQSWYGWPTPCLDMEFHL